MHKRDDPRGPWLPDPKEHRELAMVMMSDKTNRLSREQVLALRGLRLPTTALKQLQKAGIYCEPSVSIEHQHLARRYVIRGVESGGAVPHVGFYAGFVGADGLPLAWLQRIDSIGRNGLHAVVVAPQLVRLQMFRRGQIYELLIPAHRLETSEEGRRPTLRNTVLFRGIHGMAALELWGKDRHFSSQVAPVFLTRSGEPLLIPDIFRESVCRITAAAGCVGCRHCHLLQSSIGPIP